MDWLVMMAMSAAVLWLVGKWLVGLIRALRVRAGRARAAFEQDLDEDKL